MYHTRRPSWGRMTSGAPKWTRCGGWLGCTAGRSTSRTGTASLPPRHGGMDWNGVAHRRQFLLRGRVTRTAPVNLPQELRAGDAAHRHQLPVRIPPRFVALTFTASAYRPGSWPSAGGRPPCTLGPPCPYFCALQWRSSPDASTGHRRTIGPPFPTPYTTLCYGSARGADPYRTDPTLAEWL